MHKSTLPKPLRRCQERVQEATPFSPFTAASIVPSAGFLHTARPFINWRAFGFTFFLLLLLSLLWEVTFAIPYGWWGYRPATMLGAPIGAWSGLPVEALCVCSP